VLRIGARPHRRRGGFVDAVDFRGSSFPKERKRRPTGSVQTCVKTTSYPDESKRGFLEEGSAYGVVDVEPNGQNTVYVFVRSGLTAAQIQMIRDLALEWWDVPRVLIAVRSGTLMKAVTPSHDQKIGR
jgi:hypothetical protein